MTSKEFVDRFGGSLAIVAALAFLVVVMPATTSKSSSSGVEVAQTTGGSTATSAPNATGPATADTVPAGSSPAAANASGGGRSAAGAATGAAAKSGAPAPGAVAPSATGGVRFGSGPNCRADGRQKAIDTYAPPCADWTKGTANGGATAKGVTADKIRLIRYLNYVDAGTKAALQGAGATDDDATLQRQFDAYVRYFNTHYETYGRQVVVENFPASGQGDEESFRADAVAIANKGAFAVITTDPSGPAVFAQELSARGVLCICTVSLSTTFYSALPATIFTTLPPSEEFFANITEYICNRLVGNGRTAQWAGDELNPTQGFKNKPRKFGLVWYEGAGTTPEPGYKAAHDYFMKHVKEACGVSVVDFGYLADATQAQNYSQAMIGKMVTEGVTTVMFSVDPITPIFFTQEATRQHYFPEWLNMGTALTDETFFGRTYDQAQWRHSFGISPLGTALDDPNQSAAYREYFVARPNDKPGDQGVAYSVTRAPISLFFTGVHMAGPNLTADSFAKGMFAYPKTGIDPAHPLTQFTRQSPAAIKDFKEIWWNPTATGKDETGKQGTGMMMVANGGARHTVGTWPAGDPKAFDPNGAVTTVPTKESGDGATPVPDSTRCLSCS